MNADTRKVMLFIAVGIIAAATIGLLVWRMSIPGAPAPESRNHHAAAQTSSLSATTAPSPTHTSPSQETSPEDSAPEVLAQPQREEQYDSPTMLRAKPTKIYRPDSVSAQGSRGTDADEGLGDSPAETDLALPSGEAPIATQQPAPKGAAEEPPSATPTKWPDGLTPLSEAIEQTQEEFSKLPGISDLPIPPVLPMQGKDSPGTSEETDSPEETSEPQDSRDDAGAHPATAAPSSPAPGGDSTQTPHPSDAPTPTERPSAPQRAVLPSSSTPRG